MKHSCTYQEAISTWRGLNAAGDPPCDAFKASTLIAWMFERTKEEVVTDLFNGVDESREAEGTLHSTIGDVAPLWDPIEN